MAKSLSPLKKKTIQIQFKSKLPANFLLTFDAETRCVDAAVPIDVKEFVSSYNGIVLEQQLQYLQLQIAHVRAISYI